MDKTFEFRNRISSFKFDMVFPQYQAFSSVESEASQGLKMSCSMLKHHKTDFMQVGGPPRLGVTVISNSAWASGIDGRGQWSGISGGKMTKGNLRAEGESG